LVHGVYTFLGPSFILAALLHGTPAAGLSQTVAWYKEWNYGTFPEGATYIFDWAAITFVTGPHCSITVNYGRPA